ncbi:MAG: sigma-70 family RNA polymerase sigma factor [Planctomycetes bacterium]|jgi:RNA polymerase sigma-70 factor (ECF subfamily)|nr:sigma-70 family RNA polymerase sigma factor [Planctomycetota bacterium]
MTTDAAWIEASVARFERPLIAYARRILGDDDEARDVVQDTFLRLCRQPRGEVEHRLVEWLFTVLRHVAIDRLRKERPMSTIADHDLTEAAPAPSARMEQQEESSGLLGALATLPRNQQDCIRLKFQQGMSYQQISGVTGLSVGNVGFLIHTGIKTLRARLAPLTASTTSASSGPQP